MRENNFLYPSIWDYHRALRPPASLTALRLVIPGTVKGLEGTISRATLEVGPSFQLSKGRHRSMRDQIAFHHTHV
jgi:hypothetical protein